MEEKIAAHPRPYVHIHLGNFCRLKSQLGWRNGPLSFGYNYGNNFGMTSAAAPPERVETPRAMKDIAGPAPTAPPASTARLVLAIRHGGA